MVFRILRFPALSAIVLVCCTTLLLRAPVDAVASTVALHYVANAGVLLSYGDAKILIDAPIRQGIPPYATSEPAERDRLERAVSPYDRVDAILITHWHEDHFSPEAVAAHLASNGRAVLISSPEVVDRVRAVAPQLPLSRLRSVLPSPGGVALEKVGAVPVRALRIRHNPARRFPEQHLGFLVGDQPAVLHTGDADPVAENFVALRTLPPVNLALLPFWYLQSNDNRQVVRDAIAPAQVVALHLPPGDAESVGREFGKTNVNATLLIHPGTPVVLSR